jgi:hypothetical protein
VVASRCWCPRPHFLKCGYTIPVSATRPAARTLAGIQAVSSRRRGSKVGMRELGQAWKPQERTEGPVWRRSRRNDSHSALSKPDGACIVRSKQHLL